MYFLSHRNTSKTKKKKLNSVAVVRKRTIPTERPPLVGELSSNLCGYRVLRGQRNEFPRPLITDFLDHSRYRNPSSPLKIKSVTGIRNTVVVYSDNL
jgi:hypothetical protein